MKLYTNDEVAVLLAAFHLSDSGNKTFEQVEDSENAFKHYVEKATTWLKREQNLKYYLRDWRQQKYFSKEGGWTMEKDQAVGFNTLKDIQKSIESFDKYTKSTLVIDNYFLFDSL